MLAILPFDRPHLGNSQISSTELVGGSEDSDKEDNISDNESVGSDSVGTDLGTRTSPPPGIVISVEEVNTAIPSEQNFNPMTEIAREQELIILRNAGDEDLPSGAHSENGMEGSFRKNPRIPMPQHYEFTPVSNDVSFTPDHLSENSLNEP